ncbi:hypothetical protein KEJ39_02080 [Candidatus Bathyarchaeota archaeon]|nr:hypothetical protein [Candidatus Bathyarchaeota archaeon]
MPLMQVIELFFMKESPYHIRDVSPQRFVGGLSDLALSGELYEAVIRIVDQRVGEIKVTREDFDRLTKTVSELSGIVRELAEAQKRTEDAVGRLTVAVGSLSDTVGYSLEDVARVMLPPWLERHERVKVEELERRFIKVEGESVEVDLYGEGMKARTPIVVVGEAKSRIHVGDVKEFAGKVEKIQRALKQERILPLMFGYWIHPSATSLGKTLHIRLVASYQR